MEAEKDLQPQVVAEAASNPKKAENPVKVVVTSNGGSDEGIIHNSLTVHRLPVFAPFIPSIFMR
jgi:hypothetical protein